MNFSGLGYIPDFFKTVGDVSSGFSSRKVDYFAVFTAGLAVGFGSAVPAVAV
jgi:hypothetical protein